MKTLEKKQGLNGSGKAIWCIHVFNAAKKCVWVHKFDTEGEADSWIKYAY